MLRSLAKRGQAFASPLTTRLPAASFRAWPTICSPRKHPRRPRRNSRQKARRLPSPRGCGRACWRSSSARATSSGRGNSCAARSRRIAFPPLILFGPPGTGKTTLAQIIANATRSQFERLNGVESQRGGYAPRDRHRRKPPANLRREARSCSSTKSTASTKPSRTSCSPMSKAASSGSSARPRTIRFFTSTPRSSRARRFSSSSRSRRTTSRFMKRALADTGRGFGKRQHRNLRRRPAPPRRHRRRRRAQMPERPRNRRAHHARGNHRHHPFHPRRRRGEHPAKAVVYDADGDQHYDTISAFIKSMRGSDPDAALYWLAKMLYAGEDIRFIARRIVICASEDVGMADPQALVVAVAAQQSSGIHRPARGADSPRPRDRLHRHRAEEQPRLRGHRQSDGRRENRRHPRRPETPARHALQKLREARPRRGLPIRHDFEGGYVPQAYLPEGRVYYEPTELGFEKRIKERLEHWRAVFEKSQAGGGSGA